MQGELATATSISVQTRRSAAMQLVQYGAAAGRQHWRADSLLPASIESTQTQLGDGLPGAPNSGNSPGDVTGRHASDSMRMQALPLVAPASNVSVQTPMQPQAGTALQAADGQQAASSAQTMQQVCSIPYDAPLLSSRVAASMEAESAFTLAWHVHICLTCIC